MCPLRTGGHRADERCQQRHRTANQLGASSSHTTTPTLTYYYKHIIARCVVNKTFCFGKSTFSRPSRRERSQSAFVRPAPIEGIAGFYTWLSVEIKRGVLFTRQPSEQPKAVVRCGVCVRFEKGERMDFLSVSVCANYMFDVMCRA